VSNGSFQNPTISLRTAIGIRGTYCFVSYKTYDERFFSVTNCVVARQLDMHVFRKAPNSNFSLPSTHTHIYIYHLLHNIHLAIGTRSVFEGRRTQKPFRSCFVEENRRTVPGYSRAQRRRRRPAGSRRSPPPNCRHKTDNRPCAGRLRVKRTIYRPSRKKNARVFFSAKYFDLTAYLSSICFGEEMIVPPAREKIRREKKPIKKVYTYFAYIYIYNSVIYYHLPHTIYYIMCPTRVYLFIERATVMLYILYSPVP